MTRARRDLRVIAEITVIVLATWLLLAWLFDRSIEQADATVMNVPYAASQLRAGFDWTHLLYRFGIVGGSPMQEIGGAPPLVQLCAALGVSATLTANAILWAQQIFIAFFGIKTAEALASAWSGAPRALTLAERIVATWLCAFAPGIAWRFAIGDDQLVIGLLPFLAITTLAWCARARTLNVTTVLVAAAAAAQGISGWGAQSIVYSATFGAPIAIAAFARRWTRREWIAVAAVLGGVLLVLPRLVNLAAYSSSGDAVRSIHGAVAYSYTPSVLADWAGSLPWTRALAHGVYPGINEQNVPIGPLIVIIAATRASRRLGAVVLACALLAILYALDVWPVNQLASLPVVGAFRVPARAIQPAIMMIAPLAVAAFAVHRAPERPRREAIIVALAALVVAGGAAVPGIAREVLAWLAVGALVVRGRLPRLASAAFPLFALVAALGVVAFDERFLRDVPHERIEELAALRATLIGVDPSVASPLTRVEIVDPPPPYDMSTAWAADLSSLDGVWYPPRRFLSLLAALKGRPVPLTTCVFSLGHDPVFPILQQLYNVKLAVAVRKTGVDAQPLPPTNGPAWFPARVVAGDEAAFGAALRASHDLRADLAATAWGPEPSTCTGATVRGVTTDRDGQRASIAVSTTQPCALVVATNFVEMFVATDEAGHRLRVFPIDVALTGIDVPAGAQTIELVPQAYTPWWSYLAAWLGGALVLLAAVASYRSPRVSP